MRTLRVLEYNKIISMLESYTLSEPGKIIVRKIRPEKDYNIVKTRLEETSEALEILKFLGSSPMDIFPDIRDSLYRAEIGSILSPSEILGIGKILTLAGNFVDKISKYPEPKKISLILSISEGIHKQRHLRDEIYRCIESEDKLSDHASSKLLNIRRRILRANDRIRDRLNSMINSSQYQKFLQEPLITIRNQRYVIPVKQEHKASVPGMIHDQSSSGATLFIEPMAVVEINNEIRELGLEEEKEIERILSELTSIIENCRDNLLNNFNILLNLDLIFSRGHFSLSYKGIMPKIIDRPHIRIVNGRHPLIDPGEVVPISIEFRNKTNCLVITGPNTGGKTVTLKTAGLFVLMAQTGLHLPTDYGTEIGIFQDVFADIGDEQSIEQSLSTFSSHMVHIAEIVEKADTNSLVLFDELGAGTDPTEGAALAMAILEHFRNIGTYTMATTHYSELKLFALTTKGMENASMEFDVETLKPTYRLLMGVPGKSNAFEISTRLGLRPSLIKDAKKYLSQEEIRFEDILADMEQNRIKTKEERGAAQDRLYEAQRLKQELEQKLNRIKDMERESKDEARREARNIIRKAKVESDIILKRMLKLSQASIDKNARREAQEARDKLHENLIGLEKSMLEGKATPRVKGEPPENLKPGETVYIINLDQKGQVLEVSDDGELVQIQVGIMKINANIRDIRKEDTKVQPKKKSSTTISMKNKTISMELDLRGMDVESAIVEVDKYLDDVFLAGLEEVVLIHGKGTGVLRKGLHQHLNSHSHVNSFRLGRFGEGETGVTIVELK